MSGRIEHDLVLLSVVGVSNVKQLKYLSAVSIALVLLSLGCASTSTQESSGEYIDDSFITAKVKKAISNGSSLKSAEINVETFKGVVQSRGFVNSRSDINRALKLQVPSTA